MLPEVSPEALEKGALRQDMGYIKVAGKNFDLVTTRIKGGLPDLTALRRR